MNQHVAVSGAMFALRMMKIRPCPHFTELHRYGSVFVLLKTYQNFCVYEQLHLHILYVRVHTIIHAYI